ncbi:Hypothetical protein PROPAUS_1416 [Propionibacterium australiense]|uniref:Uncharacterized protein n=1 Tax=Propionibacterium australiense TaxID=119981 RepID=A0A383S6F3_9ACTN|nr:Hypothetical protein PROPAUS_1416 [Propionibacterium australiense]
MINSPHRVRGNTTIDTATVTRTVATNGGNKRLNVFTHRSTKNGIRPRSVRRTNELVIKYAEIMMKASTPIGEPTDHA